MKCDALREVEVCLRESGVVVEWWGCEVEEFIELRSGKGTDYRHGILDVLESVCVGSG